MAAIVRNAQNNSLLAKEVVSRAERLIRCASRYDGLAFGGYVRDMVIPLHFQGKKLVDLDFVDRSKDPYMLSNQRKSKGVPDFKDIDLWFKTQEDADRFIAELENETGLEASGVKLPDLNSNYVFSRKQCSIFEHDQWILIVDIIVCSVFPVGDFSLNLFTWDGKELQCKGHFEPGNDVKSLSDALKDMDNKITYMSLTYDPSLVIVEPRRRMQARRIERFLREGWTIFVWKEGKKSKVLGANQYNYGLLLEEDKPAPISIQPSDVKEEGETLTFTIPCACTRKIKVEICPE